jgi:hypothetical protein
VADAIVEAPWPVLLASLQGQPAETVDEALRVRFRHDRAAFARVLFPLRVTGSWSAYHLDMLARPAVHWSERRGQARRLDIAHRGAAKSTLATFVDLVHAVVYGLDRFIAIASATDDLSAVFVKNLHRAFTDRSGLPMLHDLYGPIRVSGGMTDFVVSVDGQPSCRIGSFSARGPIRGQNHEGQRPTRIVYDDMEHPEDSRSPARREAAWRWVVSDAGEAGDPTCCLHQWVGTTTHRDGPVMRAALSPAWRSTSWRALQGWPERMDLWEQARALWADLTDADREGTARRWYEERRAEMDAGAAPLWPERYPLFDLMCRYWASPASFAAEMQNDPRDPQRAVFDVEAFRRCRWDGAGTVVTSRGRVVRLSACDVGVWLDPIPPSETGRDFAAIATVARERATGLRMVLSVKMRRLTPSQQREAMWSEFERWGTRAVYGYEDNAFAALFGEDFKRDQLRRKTEGRPWQLSIAGVPSIEDKMEVIASLEPAVANGWLEFDAALDPAVIDQFADVPNGAHDDGADAVARADRLVCARQAQQVRAW